MSYTFTQQEKMIRQSISDDAQAPLEALVLLRLITNFSSLYKIERANLLQQHGLNETQFLALTLIYYQNNQATQPSVLSRMLNLPRTNITRISDDLENHGWIERRLIKTDRRAYLLSLTAKGKIFLETYLPNQWQFIGTVFSVLNETESQQLQEIMRKLNAQMEQMTRLTGEE